MWLDPNFIRKQIDALFIAYPELVDDEQLRADVLEGETGLHEFLSKMEFARQATCALAGGVASHIAQLDERLGRFERREKAMRELMFKLMQVANLSKLELPEATLSIRNGTPKVLITDDTRLPEWCWRVKREPNLSKLKEELTSGMSIAGAELSNAEPTLSIRTK